MAIKLDRSLWYVRAYHWLRGQWELFTEKKPGTFRSVEEKMNLCKFIRRMVFYPLILFGSHLLLAAIIFVEFIYYPISIWGATLVAMTFGELAIGSLIIVGHIVGLTWGMIYVEQKFHPGAIAAGQISQWYDTYMERKAKRGPGLLRLLFMWIQDWHEGFCRDIDFR